MLKRVNIELPLTQGQNAAIVEALFREIDKSGAEWRVRCPFHDGNDKNCSINVETGLWCCHSKCSRGGTIFEMVAKVRNLAGVAVEAEVVSILGLDKRLEPTIVATFDYRDEAANLLYQSVRLEPGRNGK